MNVYDDLVQEILSEYKESAVGVIGCWAKGISYPVCELDLLVSSQRQPNFERRVKQQLVVDVMYLDEQSLSKQCSGLIATTLSECLILQDPKLHLASVVSLAKTRVSKEGRALASSALTKAVSYLGLAKRAFKEGCNMSAGCWLLSAGYCLIEVLAWVAGDKPRPSHVLNQFRSYAGAHSDALSSTLGLAEATTTSVKRRLEFLAKLYEAGSFGLLGDCELEKSLPTLASKKTLYLLESNMVVDAYAYLGYLIVKALERIYKGFVERLPAARLHRFIEDLDDRRVLGKGAVKTASFPLFDLTIVQDVEQAALGLAQNF